MLDLREVEHLVFMYSMFLRLFEMDPVLRVYTSMLSEGPIFIIVEYCFIILVWLVETGSFCLTIVWPRSSAAIQY